MQAHYLTRINSFLEERPEFDDIPKEPFHDYHVEWFIRDFAVYENSAGMFLEDQGYRKEVACAETFRNLCRAWVKNREDVYKVCGEIFWREMKEMAQEAYDAD